MDDYISQMWGGPGHLRFYLQPLLAIGLGLRDGAMDARAGAPAYFFSLFSQPRSRRDRLLDAFKHLTIPLSVAVVMDLLFQAIIRHAIRPLPAIGYAAIFVVVPYVLARSLTNRVVSGLRRGPAVHA